MKVLKLKSLKIFMSCIILTFMISCGQAQDNTDDKKVIALLKEFYIKYNYMCATAHISATMPANIIDKKLDSIIAIYCTPKFRKKADEWLEGDGHDLV